MDAAEATREALDYDWAQHQKTVVVLGRKLNYVELGEPGRPVLLFVHGIMGTWQHWTLNMREFAKDFHVIAVDMPGFGASAMPAGRLDMHCYARTIALFCKQLQLQRVTLVGNSMGGMVGALVAKTTPQVLDRLVLVDAAGLSTADGWLRRLAPFARLIDPLLRLVFRFRNALSTRRRLIGIGLSWAVSSSFKLLPEIALMLISGAGRPGFVPAAHSILGATLDEYPGEISCPTLIVWGRKDVLIPKRDAFRFMRMIPGSDAKFIDDAGHLPMIEQPEQFNALLEEFLANDAEQASLPAAA